MAYPALAEGPATAAYTQRKDGGDVQAIVDEQTTFPDGADLSPELAHEVLNECFDLEPHLRSPSRWRFDGAVARLLHARLQLSTVCAGDADFWRWLTFAYGGCGAELVDLRYGRPMSESAETEDGAATAVRPVYYGLRQMKKGMFAKLWICAASMYRPNQSNPYDGLDYMDVDLWDSHIIDPDYGSVPEMARAFVLVVRDREIPRDARGSADGTAGYRQLAREIRRRYPTTAFELFDDEVAYHWVDALWADRETWCRISP